MADTQASFVLALIDRITAPARAMTKAVEGLAAAEKVVQAASAATSKAVETVGAAAQVATAQVAGLAKAQNALAAASRRAAGAARHGPLFNPLLAGVGPAHGPVFNRALAGSSQGFIGPVLDRAFAGQSHGFIGPRHDKYLAGADGGFIGPRRATGMERFRSNLVGNAKDFWAFNEAAGEANGKLQSFLGAFSMTPLGMAARGVGAIAGKVWDLGEALVGAALSAAKLTLALGAIAAGLFIKRIIDLADFAQKSKGALSALAGSTEAGAAQFNQARRIAMELGTSVEDVTHQFIELRAAQFSAEQSENILKLSRDLQALTGNADAASRAVLAITQIKAKGRLQAGEMLQLSEAGLSMELVYDELMKVTGIKSKDALRKAQEQGKIDGVRAVEAIQRAIMHKLHESKPGQYAIAQSNKTLSGVWERLKSMPDAFMLDIAESINTDALVAGMQAITKAFEAGGKSKLTEFAQRSIDLLGRLLPLLVDFAEGFMSAFDGVLEGIADLDPRTLKDEARTAGEWLATFFGKAITFAKEAVPVIAKAVGNFLEKFDVNGFLKTVSEIDFAKLAEDLVTIAGALGKIAGFTAKIARHVGWSPGDPVRGNAPSATTEGAIYDAVTGKGSGKDILRTMGANALDTVTDPFGIKRMAGWGASLWGWALGAGEQAAPTAEGPQASIRPGVQANQFNANVTIQAPPDPKLEELAKLARTEVEKGMRSFADRELSEAVPA